MSSASSFIDRLPYLAPVRSATAAHGTALMPARGYDAAIPTAREESVNIRPNRVKDKMAAGQVATILSGANDPDLIDQLGTLDIDGIWPQGEDGGID